MTQFNLKGMEKAIDRIKALPNDVRKKVVMGALRKSATLVVKAAKANAMRHDDPATGRKIASNIQARFGSKTYKATTDTDTAPEATDLAAHPAVDAEPAPAADPAAPAGEPDAAADA